MWDLGTANSHALGYWYGDLARFDGMTSWGMAFNIIIPSGTSGSQSGRDILSKYDVSAGTDGWAIRSGTSNTRAIACWNWGAGASTWESSGQVPEDTLTPVFCRYNDDTDVGYVHISGLPEFVSMGETNAPGSCNLNLCIGDAEENVAGNTGLAMDIGQIMIWNGYFPSDADKTDYFLGRNLPAASQLGFWVTCVDETATHKDDRIFGDTGTEQGAVNVVSGAADSLFTGSGIILPHRSVAGMNLRLFRFAPEYADIEVPVEFLSMTVGDEFGVAHPDWTQAASLLRLLDEHYGLDSWRRTRTMVMSRRYIGGQQRKVVLRLLDIEAPMCLHWNTARTSETVGNEAPGVAQWNQGWSYTNTRNSSHYIEDTTEDLDYTLLASVGQFFPKIGGKGTLREDVYKDLVPNNAGLVPGAGPPTTADWTEDLGTGGSAARDDADTVRPLFKDAVLLGYDVLTPSLTKGSAGDCLYKWTVTPDNTDNSRLYFWHQQDGTISSAPNFWIQRSSDSQYWQGGSAWNASKVWHTAAATSDGDYVRNIGAVIGNVPGSGTLTIAIGMEDTSHAEGDIVYIPKLAFVQSSDIVSDILTLESGTTTSEADADQWDLDINGDGSGRQTFHVDHGTWRFRIYVELDNWILGTKYVLGQWGVSTTDFDIAWIEGTVAGADMKFARYISGSLDATATMSIGDPSRGTWHEGGVRWTGADGELDLPIRTLSCFWNGAKGTDAAASGVHSSSDETTFYREGSATESGYVPLKNWISDCEMKQKALPDEAMLGGRIAA